jgi:hypothetical protein
MVALVRITRLVADHRGPMRSELRFRADDYLANSQETRIGQQWLFAVCCRSRT